MLEMLDAKRRYGTKSGIAFFAVTAHKEGIRVR